MSLDLGLSCAVEDLLDVRQFRHDFLFGPVLGTTVRDGDFAAAWSRWTVPTESLPCPKTAQQAMQLLNEALWGNVPDSVIAAHLAMHTDRLATQTGIRLQLRRVAMSPIDDDTGQYDELRPRAPWVGTNAIGGVIRIELPGPVISVGRVRAIAADGTVSWTVQGSNVTIIDRRGGLIELGAGVDTTAPIASPSETLVRGASNLFSSALRFNMLDTVPGVWAVEYVTGPVWDGRAGRLPLSIKFQVWCQAAKFLLALHSNVTTKGVSSQNRSVDGISNSISLTNSATSDINAALETILDKFGELVDTKMLARRMRGLPCRAF